MCSSLRALWLGMLGSLVLAQAILALKVPGTAEPSQLPTGETVQPRQQTSIKIAPPFEIKVEISRRRTTPGDVVGVVADVTNNSPVPIYFRPQDVQLVFAQEVERSVGGSWDAWLPTEYTTREVTQQRICLQTGGTYRLFFATANRQNQSAWSRFSDWLSYIGFVPGTYPVTVIAKYWDRADFSGDNYRTAVDSKTVEYSAPLTIVMVGAVIGGILFTLLSIIRAEENQIESTAKERVIGGGKMFLQFLGAGLLSAIVTILLSRIDETQFFVKVSVSDFWGAIAVGFLANYGGWALLDKMIPRATKESARTGGEGSRTDPKATEQIIPGTAVAKI